MLSEAWTTSMTLSQTISKRLLSKRGFGLVSKNHMCFPLFAELIAGSKKIHREKKEREKNNSDHD